MGPEDLCGCSFLSRFWGWVMGIFQLSGFHCIVSIRWYVGCLKGQLAPQPYCRGLNRYQYHGLVFLIWLQYQILAPSIHHPPKTRPKTAPDDPQLNLIWSSCGGVGCTEEAMETWITRDLQWKHQSPYAAERKSQHEFLVPTSSRPVHARCLNAMYRLTVPG